jgi:hypothetical protein
MWQDVAKNANQNRVLLENPLFYPRFKAKMLDLPDVDNIEIIGGGRDECLKEIELFLRALNKNVKITEELCYGRDGLVLQENKKSIRKKI